MSGPPSRADVLAAIDDVAPAGAAVPTARAQVERLRHLATELVRSYGEDALDRDPFSDAYQRRVAVLPGVEHALAGRTVLVTGGEGHIGDHLARTLATYGVRRIVSVDNARGADGARSRVLIGPQVPLVRYRADVRRQDHVSRVFAAERPDVVFHLAAQRLPGLAEREVRRTVSTNLLGIRNVAAACEAGGVERCVVASTAKAAQFLATDVYAGSKKLAEWWLAGRAAAGGPTRYSVARFTHVAENSPVASEIDEKLQRGVLDLHGPDRFIQVQSVEEAVGLLLDGLVLGDEDTLRLVAVHDPGWPVDVLELALHLMRRSGEVVPVCFRGLPKGYLGRPFQGQFDWDGDETPSSMVNAGEAGRREGADGSLLVARPMPVPYAVVADAFDRIAAVLERPSDGESGERAMGIVFTEACREATAGSFALASPDFLAGVLVRGCDPAGLEDPEHELREHRHLLELLLDAVHERPPPGGDAAFQRALRVAEQVAGTPEAPAGQRAWREAG